MGGIRLHDLTFSCIHSAWLVVTWCGKERLALLCVLLLSVIARPALLKSSFIGLYTTAHLHSRLCRSACAIMDDVQATRVKNNVSSVTLSGCVRIAWLLVYIELINCAWLLVVAKFDVTADVIYYVRA